MKLFQWIAGFSLSFALIIPCSVSAATYTLTTQANGNGSVARNPTNNAYPGGAVVTITALPAEGWFFSSWSGDVTGTNNPINVTMDANKVVAANFSQRTLTVNISGQGYVSPAGGGYSNGAVVRLTATPSNGWIFHHWSGDAGGSANPLSLTMSGDRTVTATFIQPLQISAQPVGTNVNAGESATFSVMATGTGPISYQWRFNESAVPGETGSLFNLSNVQKSQAGSYRVVVSSPYSALTSQIATLTVACLGTNTVLICTEAELRQAIGRGGHVRFCCNGTITLTNTITIERDVTLDGTGMSVAISGGNAVRLFNVSPGVFFTVSNLALADGLHLGANGANAAGATPAQDGLPAAGGAIYNSSGTVQLVSCVLSNNHTQGGNGGSGGSQAPANGRGGNATGGGIYNSGGTVLLQNVEACYNEARGGNGGTFNSGPGSYGSGGEATGGAVHNEGGTLSVWESFFSHNQAYAFGGLFTPRPNASGGAIFQSGGSSELNDSNLSSNRSIGASATGTGTFPYNSGANARGGAVAVTGGFSAIQRSVFQSNQAQGGNTFRFSGVGEAMGGAVFGSATLVINNSEFSGNVAQPGGGGGSRGPASGWGGALYNVASLDISGSSLAGNIVYGSAGYCVGTPQGSAGTAAYGGAVCNLQAGSLRATNCTLTLNHTIGGAPCTAGVSAGAAYGGGIYNEGSNVTLINVTVASNAVSITPSPFQPGLAAGANVANTNGTFTLHNSLLAYPGTNANAWGNITDGGFNISSDGSANFSSGSSFNFTDPRLLPLADNGGPTLTMALLPDSPAIDFAGAVGAPVTDQRGMPRPFGGGIDIGAFEAGPAVPALVVRRSAANVNVTFPAEAGVSYRLQRSLNLFDWETEESFGAMPTNGIISRSYPFSQPMRFYRLTLDF